jgi:hypothetical protein
MKGLLYPVLDLDAATPDELRRHARDLHHRLSDAVKRLESVLADNRQLEADLRETKKQRNDFLALLSSKKGA